MTKFRDNGGSTEVYVEFIKEPQCRLADRPMWLMLANLVPVR